MAQQALNNLARGAIGIGAAASLAQASLFNVDGGFRAVMFNRLQGVQVSTTALAQAQHCRSISGSETRLLCECADPGTVEAIRRAASEDKVGVPCAALLRCNADLWFEALRDAL